MDNNNKNLNERAAERINHTIEALFKIVLVLQNLFDLLVGISIVLADAILILGQFLGPLRLLLTGIASFWELINQMFIQKGHIPTRSLKVLIAFSMLGLVMVSFALPELGAYMLMSIFGLDVIIQTMGFGTTLWYWFKTIFKNEKSDNVSHPKIEANINLIEAIVSYGCSLTNLVAGVLYVIPGVQVIGISILMASCAIELTTKLISWSIKTGIRKFFSKNNKEDKPTVLASEQEKAKMQKEVTHGISAVQPLLDEEPTRQPNQDVGEGTYSRLAPSLKFSVNDAILEKTKTLGEPIRGRDRAMSSPELSEGRVDFVSQVQKSRNDELFRQGVATTPTGDEFKEQMGDSMINPPVSVCGH